MQLPRTSLVVLALALGCRAQSDGSCNGAAPSDACSATGTSSAYAETVNGATREIRASGCPNNNPVTNCLGDNPSRAAEQDWHFDVPATPMFVAGSYEASLAAATPLGEVGGLIAMTRNGVEVRVQRLVCKLERQLTTHKTTTTKKITYAITLPAALYTKPRNEGA